jgi:septal ring factor EnvC (AmiA/AmiB activator)
MCSYSHTRNQELQEELDATEATNVKLTQALAEQLAAAHAAARDKQNDDTRIVCLQKDKAALEKRLKTLSEECSSCQRLIARQEVEMSDLKQRLTVADENLASLEDQNLLSDVLLSSLRTQLATCNVPNVALRAVAQDPQDDLNGRDEDVGLRDEAVSQADRSSMGGQACVKDEGEMIAMIHDGILKAWNAALSPNELEPSSCEPAEPLGSLHRSYYRPQAPASAPR